MYKNYDKKLSYNCVQNQEEMSQKIKELIQADPALVDSIEDGVVKEEIKKIREIAREERAGGLNA